MAGAWMAGLGAGMQGVGSGMIDLYKIKKQDEENAFTRARQTAADIRQQEIDRQNRDYQTKQLDFEAKRTGFAEQQATRQQQEFDTQQQTAETQKKMKSDALLFYGDSIEKNLKGTPYYEPAMAALKMGDADQINKIYEKKVSQDFEMGKTKFEQGEQTKRTIITNTPKPPEPVDVNDKIDRANEVLDKIEALKSHRGFNAAVGSSGPMRGFGLWDPISGSPAAAFNAQLESLKSLLTEENLKKLKGTISDKDIVFLKSIATSLDNRMPEKDFNQELDRVYKKFDSALVNLTGKSRLSTDPNKTNDFDALWGGR